MNEEMDSPNRVWQLLRREFCSQCRGGNGNLKGDWIGEIWRREVGGKVDKSGGSVIEGSGRGRFKGEGGSDRGVSV